MQIIDRSWSARRDHDPTARTKMTRACARYLAMADPKDPHLPAIDAASRTGP
jgi:hypothetical protein